METTYDNKPKNDSARATELILRQGVEGSDSSSRGQAEDIKVYSDGSRTGIEPVFIAGQQSGIADSSIAPNSGDNSNLFIRSGVGNSRPKPQTHGKALDLQISASEDELVDLEEEIRLNDQKELLLAELRKIEEQQKQLLERKRTRIVAKKEAFTEILLSYRANTSVLVNDKQDATTTNNN